MFLVLGDYLWRARYWPHRHIPWRLWPPAGEDQCLLQWGQRRQVCPKGRPCGPRARHHGQREVRTLWSDLQTRQLCVWSIWSWQQLGQGSLYRGCRVGGQCPRCCQKRGWKLWLSSGKNKCKCQNNTKYRVLFPFLVRVSNLHILLVVELDLVWEHSSSPRSEKSIPTESWTPTLLYHLPRYQTPWWSHTMPPCQFTNWLRTQMRPTVLTMRLSMTSASEHWNLPPQHMVTSTI